MNFAHLDDGRRVIVDSSANQERGVEGEAFFLPFTHVNVFLEGSWQTVRRDRLKNTTYGNPFKDLK